MTADKITENPQTIAQKLIQYILRSVDKFVLNSIIEEEYQKQTTTDLYKWHHTQNNLIFYHPQNNSEELKNFKQKLDKCDTNEKMLVLISEFIQTGELHKNSANTNLLANLLALTATFSTLTNKKLIVDFILEHGNVFKSALEAKAK